MHPKRHSLVNTGKEADVNGTFAKPRDYAARPPLERFRNRGTVVCRGACITVGRGILVSDLHIVGDDEADARGGRIAEASPLARALLGARLGETVEFQSGGRVEEIRILAISPAK